MSALLISPADLPAQLDAYIAKHRASRFAWGSLDCCQFAAGWLYVLSGKRLMEKYSYGNARQAYRAMQAAGGLAHAVPAAMDEAGVPYRCASLDAPPRGALVLIHTRRRAPGVKARGYAGWALGVPVGLHLALPGVDGLAFERLPSQRACAAWELLA